MRICPICGSSYDAAVDFCFKDGAPLSDPPGVGRDAAGTSFSDLSLDDLEPPDAISLSNIPAVLDDEDSVSTQQLPTDLVDADELDRATADRLTPVADPEDDAPEGPDDPAGSMVDPFGGHSHELFRAKLAGTGDTPVVDHEPEDPSLPPDGPGALMAPTPDVLSAPPAAAAASTPKGAPAAASKPKASPAAGASKPAAKAPPTRTPPAGSAPRGDGPAEGGNRGILGFVGVAALLLIGLIGWQLTSRGDAPEPVAARATPTPAATPAPTPRATPTPEATPEDAVVEGGDEPEGGAQTDPAGAEADGPSADDSAAQAAEAQRQADEARQEEQRLERERLERERREREAAARASSSTPPPMPFSADPTPRPTPKPTPTPKPQATPTPQPAAAGSPWGGTAAVLEGTLEVTTTPAGAAVTVDGRSRGNTPARVTLGPGQYEVRVVLADHFPQTRVISVAAGETAKANFKLESDKPKPPPAAAVSGSLNVITATPAELWIDGVSRGRTPTTVTLTEGPHSFRLQIEGQPPHEESFSVKFNADGKATRFFNMAQ